MADFDREAAQSRTFVDAICDRWNKAPVLQRFFASFDDWLCWMINSTNPAAYANIGAAVDQATARFELAANPGPYLQRLQKSARLSRIGALYEDGAQPTIWLYGPIVSESRSDLVSPVSVRLALQSAAQRIDRGESLLLRVNSSGGCVTGGELIGQELRTFRPRTQIRVLIDHFCHSAAALYILPQADVVVMRHGATLMLHETTWHHWGRASDCYRAARQQRQRDEREWREFAELRGIPYRRVRRLALNETYLTADQALRLGLVDEIAPALQALNTNGDVN
jgi:ATP-dependent protease ClpP protease subunit